MGMHLLITRIYKDSKYKTIINIHTTINVKDIILLKKPIKLCHDKHDMLWWKLNKKPAHLSAQYHIPVRKISGDNVHHYQSMYPEAETSRWAPMELKVSRATIDEPLSGSSRGILPCIIYRRRRPLKPWQISS